MDDLMQWLRERLAEDEAVAREQRMHEQFVYGTEQMFAVSHALVGLAPHRAVAECEAGILLLDRCQEARDAYEAQGRTWDHDSEVGRARTAALEEAVRIRALAYQRHPDYREDWRP